MAYINKEDVAKIRSALKDRFPKVKFGCRSRDSGLAVSVSVMKSPFDFSPLYRGTEGYVSINHFHISRLREQISDEAVAFLILIDETIRNVGNHYDNSDSMTDHFDVAFYYDINIGRYDKPHEQVEMDIDLYHADLKNETDIREEDHV